MVESYWDLYVAYIAKCVRDNWANDIDPHHYRMEWNHTLPQCIFKGHGPGQWLTLKQHSIASALQSLVFGTNCMCGWHKSYLSPALLELAWPYFCKAASENGVKGGLSSTAEKDERGKSVNAAKSGSMGAAAAHAEKDEFGRSIQALRAFKGIHEIKNDEGKSIIAVKGAKTRHEEKNEEGKSVFAVRARRKQNEVTHSKKDEFGRSIHGLKAAERLNAEKDEFGRSVNAMKTNSQVWESTVDGFRSNPGAVACHNKTNGWDPAARVRIS